jgi:hypothetical protein
LLVLWFLLAPVVVVIDSLREDYRVEIRSIGGVWFLPQEDWKVHFRIFFFQKDYFLFKPRKKKVEAPGKKKEKKKQKGRTFFKMKPRTLLRKGRRVLNTFKIRRCKLDLDTDDYVANAYLYPIFTGIKAVTHNRLDTSINFRGEVILQVRVVNCLGRMVWAALW